MYKNISVIIPVYNVPAAILSKSLNSIKDQTYPYFEAIIIDDSTDANCSDFCLTFCIADSRFRYIKTPTRLGLPKSLNHGIAIANYDLIARFDSDDICLPNRLELQIDHINTNPLTDVLGGAIEIVDNSDKFICIRTYPVAHKAIKRSMQIQCAIAHPTVLFKKYLVIEYGGYNEDFIYSEDIEMWLRWLNAGAIFSNLNAPLVKYRQSEFIRSNKHYRYFIKARINNFSYKFSPYNLFGIIILLANFVLPKRIRRAYYKYKYKLK